MLGVWHTGGMAARMKTNQNHDCVWDIKRPRRNGVQEKGEHSLQSRNTRHLLSFFFWFAFTYNIKSSSVINIVGTCFLVNTRLSLCRAKLFRSQCHSRLATAIYGYDRLAYLFGRAKVWCFGWRFWTGVQSFFCQRLLRHDPHTRQ